MLSNLLDRVLDILIVLLRQPQALAAQAQAQIQMTELKKSLNVQVAHLSKVKNVARSTEHLVYVQLVKLLKTAFVWDRMETVVDLALAHNAQKVRILLESV
jgi:hypothetical protein